MLDPEIRTMEWIRDTRCVGAIAACAFVPAAAFSAWYHDQVRELYILNQSMPPELATRITFGLAAIAIAAVLMTFVPLGRSRASVEVVRLGRAATLAVGVGCAAVLLLLGTLHAVLHEEYDHCDTQTGRCAVVR